MKTGLKHIVSLSLTWLQVTVDDLGVFYASKERVKGVNRKVDLVPCDQGSKIYPLQQMLTEPLLRQGFK